MSKKATLQSEISQMESVLNDADTPKETKEILSAAVKEAKSQLASIEAEEKKVAAEKTKQQQTVSVIQEKIKKAAPKAKEKLKPVLQKAKETLKKTKVKETKVKQKTAKTRTSLSSKVKGILAKASAAQKAFNKGRSEEDLKRDAGRKAKPAGMRTTAHGTKYYEGRANRSDVNRRSRPYLAEGGELKEGANGYIAFYRGKEMEVYADSSYQAQVKAAKAFKAKKSYDVTVVLAEQDGEQVTHSTSAFAKGGEVEGVDITEDLKNFDINNLDIFERRLYDHLISQSAKEEVLQVLINGVEGDYSQLSEELAELAEKQHPQDEWDEEEYKNYKEGGEIGHAEISGVRKNIMGTGSFMMKMKGMKKAQEFDVYPMSKGKADSNALVQSDTRIGYINLETGSISMSQPHAGGAYFHHLNFDKRVEGKLSEEDREKLKTFIMGTADEKAGIGSGMFSDNSAAAELASGGRLKSALMRDRAYKSQQKHEQEYRRKLSPRNPHYQYEEGGMVLDNVHKDLAVEPFVGYWQNAGYTVTTKKLEDGSTQVIGKKDIGSLNPSGKAAENINVFGYETKHFDICPTAVEQFKKAINIFETERDPESALWKNQTESLNACAVYADIILGIRKSYTGNNPEISEITMKNIVGAIEVFGIYNYKSGLKLSSEFIAYHLEQIFAEKKKYDLGGAIMNMQIGGLDADPRFDLTSPTFEDGGAIMNMQIGGLDADPRFDITSASFAEGGLIGKQKKFVFKDGSSFLVNFVDKGGKPFPELTETGQQNSTVSILRGEKSLAEKALEKADEAGLSFERALYNLIQAKIFYKIYEDGGSLNPVDDFGTQGAGSYAEGGSIDSKRIEDILHHYVAAALWSTQNPDIEDEEMLDEDYSFKDVDEKTLDQMRKDIISFISKNKTDIEESGMTDEELGHDLWLSRNGHGAGFFDRNYDWEIGNRLQKAAREMKGVDLYVGNDDKIHQEGSYAKGGGVKKNNTAITFEGEEMVMYKGKLVPVVKENFQTGLLVREHVNPDYPPEFVIPDWNEVETLKEYDMRNYVAFLDKNKITGAAREKALKEARENNYYNQIVHKVKAGAKQSMAKGGKVTFKDKVKAVTKNLKGKKVPPKYKKQYGKKFNLKEAKEAATRIVGGLKKKVEKKKKQFEKVDFDTIDNGVFVQ